MSRTDRDRMPVAIVTTAAVIAAQGPVLAVSGLVGEWTSWRVSFAVIVVGALTMILLAAREMPRGDRVDVTGSSGGGGEDPTPWVPQLPGGPAVTLTVVPRRALERARPQADVSMLGVDDTALDGRIKP